MKVCSYNLENFYLGLDKYKGQSLEQITEDEWSKFSISIDHPNKPLFKCLQIAEIINKIDADVYCFQEIIGKRSLDNFVRYFLQNQYEVVVHENNSNRGIYVGFLIKKHINYKAENLSDRKTKTNKRASRNISSLLIMNNENKVEAILLGVHFKSKRSDDKVNTYDVRENEIELYKRIVLEYKTQYSVPILLLGDFNASFNNEPEFYHLKDLAFINFVDKKYSDIKKGTFGTPYLDVKVQQIDYIILEKEYEELIDYNQSAIFDYINEYGDTVSLPFNQYEKEWLPSDHCPIYLKINIGV